MRIYNILSLVMFVVLFMGQLSYAQAEENRNKQFKFTGIAANSYQLKSKNILIQLWGVVPVSEGGLQFQISARRTLDYLLNGQPAICQQMGRVDGTILAQCVNHSGTDLARYMIEKGYLTANHAEALGTIFEGPYTFAEVTAEQTRSGFWSPDFSNQGMGQDIIVIIGLGFVVVILLLGYLAHVLQKGMVKIASLQADILNLASEDKNLAKKETFILASMFQAEIESNRTKALAHLGIYKDMLSILQNPDIEPSYVQSGDVVQKQPALDRIIFDSNLAKLELMGPRISSDIIHLYARIKTKPTYVDLTPEMSREYVIKVVSVVIGNSEKLVELCDNAIKNFKKAGYEITDLGLSREDVEEEKLKEHEIALPEDMESLDVLENNSRKKEKRQEAKEALSV